MVYKGQSCFGKHGLITKYYKITVIFFKFSDISQSIHKDRF